MDREEAIANISKKVYKKSCLFQVIKKSERLFALFFLFLSLVIFLRI